VSSDRLCHLRVALPGIWLSLSSLERDHVTVVPPWYLVVLVAYWVIFVHRKETQWRSYEYSLSINKLLTGEERAQWPWSWSSIGRCSALRVCVRLEKNTQCGRLWPQYARMNWLIFSYLICLGSLDITDCIATGYSLDGWWVGVRVPVRVRSFSPCRPDLFWYPPSLLSNGYRRGGGGSFYRG
jgi:hypothetical protein